MHMSDRLGLSRSDLLRCSDFNLLYLARHAPLVPGPPPPLDLEYGIAPKYHHEIHCILVNLGFKVECSRSLNTLLQEATTPDYVFSLINRAPFRGSEVFVSAACEYRGLPYLGAGPHIRALAEDKHLAKAYARHLRIPTPPWTVYRTDEVRLTPPRFHGPYIAKPRCGAASCGITADSIQETWSALRSSVEDILATGQDVIVERLIEGRNVTLPIVGGSPPIVLPPVETSSSKPSQLITHAQKRYLEAGLTRTLYQEGYRLHEIKRYGQKLANNLQPIDYTRIDFRVPFDSREPLQMLEFNVCCNLGSHAAIAFSAQSVGISQTELILRILEYSFRRQSLLR